MNRHEFKRVYTLANEYHIMTADEQAQAIVALSGIGIFSDKSRRLATVKICAWWLRYHCLQFNSTWDMQELENHQIYFRKVDLLD